MRNLIRNMKPYKGLICIMLVLLMVQAWADMSLPQYTSDIIDTGIQNKGVEHILPEKIQDDEYQMAQIFMDNGQKTSWQKAYKKTDAEKDGKVIYKRKNLSKEKLDKLDKELLTPVVLTYQLGHMQVKQYKEVLVQSMEKNPGSAAMAGQISSMSIEQISKMPGVNIRTFKAEDQNGKTKTYVCLLYTSDAADDTPCVDLGGRRIIKKKFFQAEDGIRDSP